MMKALGVLTAFLVLGGIENLLALPERGGHSGEEPEVYREGNDAVYDQGQVADGSYVQRSYTSEESQKHQQQDTYRNTEHTLSNDGQNQHDSSSYTASQQADESYKHSNYYQQQETVKEDGKVIRHDYDRLSNQENQGTVQTSDQSGVLHEGHYRRTDEGHSYDSAMSNHQVSSVNNGQRTFAPGVQDSSKVYRYSGQPLKRTGNKEVRYYDSTGYSGQYRDQGYYGIRQHAPANEAGSRQVINRQQNYQYNGNRQSIPVKYHSIRRQQGSPENENQSYHYERANNNGAREYRHQNEQVYYQNNAYAQANAEAHAQQNTYHTNSQRRAVNNPYNINRQVSNNQGNSRAYNTASNSYATTNTNADYNRYVKYYQNGRTNNSYPRNLRPYYHGIETDNHSLKNSGRYIFISGDKRSTQYYDTVTGHYFTVRRVTLIDDSKTEIVPQAPEAPETVRYGNGFHLGHGIYYLGNGMYKYHNKILTKEIIVQIIKVHKYKIYLTPEGLPLGHSHGNYPVDLGYELYYIGNGYYRYDKEIITTEKILKFIEVKGFDIPITKDGFPVVIADGTHGSTYGSEENIPIKVAKDLWYLPNGHYKCHDRIISTIQITDFLKTTNLKIILTPDGLPLSIFDGQTGKDFKDCGYGVFYIGNGYYRHLGHIIRAVDIIKYLNKLGIYKYCTVEDNGYPQGCTEKDTTPEDDDTSETGHPGHYGRGLHLGYGIYYLGHREYEYQGKKYSATSILSIIRANKCEIQLTPDGLPLGHSHGDYPVHCGYNVYYLGNGYYKYGRKIIPTAEIAEFIKIKGYDISITKDGFPVGIADGTQGSKYGPEENTPINLGNNLFFMHNGHYKYEDQIITTTRITEFVKTKGFNVPLTPDGLPLGLFGTIYAPVDCGYGVFYVDNDYYRYLGYLIRSVDIVKYLKELGIYEHCTINNKGYPTGNLEDDFSLEDGDNTRPETDIPGHETDRPGRETDRAGRGETGSPSYQIGSADQNRIRFHLGYHIYYLGGSDYEYNGERYIASSIVKITKSKKYILYIAENGRPLGHSHGDYPVDCGHDVFYLGNGYYKYEEDIISTDDIFELIQSKGFNIRITKDGFPTGIADGTRGSKYGPKDNTPVDLGNELYFMHNGHYKYRDRIIPCTRIRTFLKRQTFSIELTPDGLPLELFGGRISGSPKHCGYGVFYLGRGYYRYLGHIIRASNIVECLNKVGILKYCNIEDNGYPIGYDEAEDNRNIERTETNSTSTYDYYEQYKEIDLGHNITYIGNGDYRYFDHIIPAEYIQELLRILNLNIDLPHLHENEQNKPSSGTEKNNSGDGDDQRTRGNPGGPIKPVQGDSGKSNRQQKEFRKDEIESRRRIQESRQQEESRKEEIESRRRTQELRQLEESTQDEIESRRRTQELRQLEESTQDEIESRRGTQELRQLEESTQDEIESRRRTQELRQLEESTQDEIESRRITQESRQLEESTKDEIESRRRTQELRQLEESTQDEIESRRRTQELRQLEESTQDEIESRRRTQELRQLEESTKDEIESRRRTQELRQLEESTKDEIESRRRTQELRQLEESTQDEIESRRITHESRQLEESTKDEIESRRRTQELRQLEESTKDEIESRRRTQELRQLEESTKDEIESRRRTQELRQLEESTQDEIESPRRTQESRQLEESTQDEIESRRRTQELRQLEESTQDEIESRRRTQELRQLEESTKDEIESRRRTQELRQLEESTKDEIESRRRTQELRQLEESTQDEIESRRITQESRQLEESRKEEKESRSHEIGSVDHNRIRFHLGYHIYYLGGSEYEYNGEKYIASSIVKITKSKKYILYIAENGRPLGHSHGDYPVDCGHDVFYLGNGYYKYEEDIISTDDISELIQSKGFNIRITKDGFPAGIADGTRGSKYGPEDNTPVDLGNELYFMHNGHYKYRDRIIPCTRIHAFLKTQTFSIELTPDGLPLELFGGRISGSPKHCGYGVFYLGRGYYRYLGHIIRASNIVECLKKHLRIYEHCSIEENGYPTGCNEDDTLPEDGDHTSQATSIPSRVVTGSPRHDDTASHIRKRFHLGYHIYYLGGSEYEYNGERYIASSIVKITKSKKYILYIAENGRPLGHSHGDYPVDCGHDVFYLGNGYYKYEEDIISTDDISELIQSKGFNIRITKDGFPAGIADGTRGSKYGPEDNTPVDLGNELYFMHNGHYKYRDRIIPCTRIRTFLKTQTFSIELTPDGLPLELFGGRISGSPKHCGYGVFYLGRGYYRYLGHIIRASNIVECLNKVGILKYCNIEDNGYPIGYDEAEDNRNIERTETNSTSTYDYYEQYEEIDLGHNITYIGNGDYRYFDHILPAEYIPELLKILKLDIDLPHLNENDQNKPSSGTENNNSDDQRVRDNPGGPIKPVQGDSGESNRQQEEFTKDEIESRRRIQESHQQEESTQDERESRRRTQELRQLEESTQDEIESRRRTQELHQLKESTQDEIESRRITQESRQLEESKKEEIESRRTTHESRQLEESTQDEIESRSRTQELRQLEESTQDEIESRRRTQESRQLEESTKDEIESRRKIQKLSHLEESSQDEIESRRRTQESRQLEESTKDEIESRRRTQELSQLEESTKDEIESSRRTQELRQLEESKKEEIESRSHEIGIARHNRIRFHLGYHIYYIGGSEYEYNGERYTASSIVKITKSKKYILYIAENGRPLGHSHGDYPVDCGHDVFYLGNGYYKYEEDIISTDDISELIQSKGFNIRITKDGFPAGIADGTRGSKYGPEDNTPVDLGNELYFMHNGHYKYRDRIIPCTRIRTFLKRQTFSIELTPDGLPLELFGGRISGSPKHCGYGVFYLGRGYYRYLGHIIRASNIVECLKKHLRIYEHCSIEENGYPTGCNEDDTLPEDGDHTSQETSIPSRVVTGSPRHDDTASHIRKRFHLGYHIYYLGGSEYEYNGERYIASSIVKITKSKKYILYIAENGRPLGHSHGDYPVDCGHDVFYLGNGYYKYEEDIISTDDIFELIQSKGFNIRITKDGFPTGIADGTRGSKYGPKDNTPVDLGNELYFMHNGHYKYRDRIIPCTRIRTFLKRQTFSIELTPDGLPLELFGGRISESPKHCGYGVFYLGRGYYRYLGHIIRASNIVECLNKVGILKYCNIEDNGYPTGYDEVEDNRNFERTETNSMSTYDYYEQYEEIDLGHNITYIGNGDYRCFDHIVPAKYMPGLLRILNLDIYLPHLHENDQNKLSSGTEKNNSDDGDDQRARGYPGGPIKPVQGDGGKSNRQQEEFRTKEIESRRRTQESYQQAESTQDERESRRRTQELRHREDSRKYGKESRRRTQKSRQYEESRQHERESRRRTQEIRQRKDSRKYGRDSRRRTQESRQHEQSRQYEREFRKRTKEYQRTDLQESNEDKRESSRNKSNSRSFGSQEDSDDTRYYYSGSKTSSRQSEKTEDGETVVEYLT